MNDPAVPFFYQERKTAGMIDVCVGEKNGRNGFWVSGEGAGFGQRLLTVTLVEAAIQKYFRRPILDQMPGSRDLVGPTMKPD